MGGDLCRNTPPPSPAQPAKASWKTSMQDAKEAWLGLRHKDGGRGLREQDLEMTNLTHQRFGRESPGLWLLQLGWGVGEGLCSLPGHSGGRGFCRKAGDAPGIYLGGCARGPVLPTFGSGEQSGLGMRFGAIWE